MVGIPLFPRNYLLDASGVQTRFWKWVPVTSKASKALVLMKLTFRWGRWISYSHTHICAPTEQKCQVVSAKKCSCVEKCYEDDDDSDDGDDKS